MVTRRFLVTLVNYCTVFLHKHGRFEHTCIFVCEQKEYESRLSCAWIKRVCFQHYLGDLVCSSVGPPSPFSLIFSISHIIPFPTLFILFSLSLGVQWPASSSTVPLSHQWNGAPSTPACLPPLEQTMSSANGICRWSHVTWVNKLTA